MNANKQVIDSKEEKSHNWMMTKEAYNIPSDHMPLIFPANCEQPGKMCIILIMKTK